MSKTGKSKHRFPEFTDADAWEQRRLGEVAEFAKGRGYSKKDICSEGTPIILYGRLYTNYETVINDVDTYTELQENSVLSSGDEVIVPSSGESAEDISRAAFVQNSGVILGGDLNIIKPNETIQSTFLAITLSNGSQQKELSKRAQGKSVVHLHNSDLKVVNLSFPTLPEQERIGAFFQTLDATIASHQRKHSQRRV
ncbi:restriction endonuclease subunit S [Streptococcus panodentis]|uniref:Restriction endonuclease subunit S n=1 Tax=Streptococcus panodentis TaxID=1581472 RepID=A0ABS5AZP8_9STRE|nr:restriction endonuclease subunit S [Streptococcus panodentis]